MIKFYQDDAGVVMFLNDDYLATDMFAIERPATADDIAAYPDEHAAFVASITPAPAPAAAPAEPVDPTPAGE